MRRAANPSSPRNGDRFRLTRDHEDWTTGDVVITSVSLRPGGYCVEGRAPHWTGKSLHATWSPAEWRELAEHLVRAPRLRVTAPSSMRRRQGGARG